MSITVTWDKSPNAAQAQPTITHIERSENGGAFGEIIAKPYGETFQGLTHVDSSVVLGTSYVYRVVFSNATGPSIPSTVTPPVIAALPLPLPPTNVKAVQS